MKRLLFAMLVTTAAIGCSQSADEPAEAPEVPDTEAVAADPEPTSTPEEAPEPDAPAFTVPAAIADLVDISPDLTLTVVETKDEAAKQYHLEADTKLNVDKVQNYYMKVYGEKGWTEDMNMSQKGNTITSYTSDDGFLIVVEATKGGKGSLVKIDTGQM